MVPMVPMRDGKPGVFIVGLGLIGGSLGLALRVSGRYSVVGLDADAKTVDRAVEIGAVDSAAGSLDEAAAADIVVVATPLFSVPSVFEGLAPRLRARSRTWTGNGPGSTARNRTGSGAENRAGSGTGTRSGTRACGDPVACPPGTIVTDVGSAKGFVMACARRHFAPDIPFVGGHPLAGSEQQGIECASSGLFRSCRYALTPADWVDPDAVCRVVDLCEAVGAVPQVLDADDHDAIVAATSHLPLLVAACVASVVGRRAEEVPSTWDMASSGFRDTTRVASGSPEMGAGMLVTNGAQVLEALEEFLGQVDLIRGEIRATLSRASQFDSGRTGREDDGDGIRAFLSRAREYRQAWLDRMDEPRGFQRGRAKEDGAGE